MKDDKPATRAVALGRMSAEHFGVVNTPVYRASTILYPDYAAMVGADPEYTYGRRGTPTTRSFEAAISDLEGAARTVTVPSGLNAIATAILSVCGAGDHLLVADNAYGPTRVFCEKTLKRYGVETGYFAAGDDIAPLLKPNTRAVFCESPGSLTFEMQDIPALAKAAHANGTSVLMDNTWATPIFFQPLRHGVDLSIQAATKYVGGHADVMLGCATATADHYERLQEVSWELGQSVSPDDAWLGSRGLRTMAVRLRQHEESALAVAEWLKAQPQVGRMLHPAFEDCPGHDHWKRDFKGSSGLFSFELRDASREQRAAFVDRLELFGIGYSWGGYESLALPVDPHRTVTQPPAPSLVRLHIGLEDTEDLIADLSSSLARMG